MRSCEVEEKDEELLFMRRRVASCKSSEHDLPTGGKVVASSGRLRQSRTGFLLFGAFGV